MTWYAYAVLTRFYIKPREFMEMDKKEQAVIIAFVDEVVKREIDQQKQLEKG